jgi:2-polyprenyl-3-methyl-5-hydroxy-6-metoxy-1,4-benzoquinol methylase
MIYKCIACSASGEDISERAINGLDGREYYMSTCVNCGSCFVSPRPSDRSLKEFYENYDGLIKSNIIESNDSDDFITGNLSVIEDSAERLRWISQYKKLSSSVRLLDVGCGYGFAVFAAKKIGIQALGIDYDLKAIDIGKKNLDISISVTSLESLSVSDSNSYDVISEWQVFEHIGNVNAHIDAIHSHLNDGGVFAGTVPNYGGLYAKIRGMAWYMIRPPEHLNYFTEDGLRILLERHGFYIEFVGTKFKTAAPLIQFGVRKKINALLIRPHIRGKRILQTIYRVLTLVKRYLFYFPINSLIYYFHLGGNTTFFVARKLP